MDPPRHQVVVLSPEGRELARWGSLGDGDGRLHFPTAIARAPDGTLLEIFEWISSKAADEAHQHPSIRTMWNKLATVADFVPLSAVQEAGKAFSHFEALSATSPRVRALAAKRPASKRPKR